MRHSSWAWIQLARRVICCSKMPRWQALQYNHLLGLDNAFGISLYEVSGGGRILPHEGERGGAKVIVGLFVKQ